MDGGGAKGVIEATILDKIFVNVAATLKVNYCTLAILFSTITSIISKLRISGIDLSGKLL